MKITHSGLMETLFLIMFFLVLIIEIKNIFNFNKINKVLTNLCDKNGIEYNIKTNKIGALQFEYKLKD